MIWVEIIITLLYILTFIGGLKEGVAKSLFSLVTLIIAIPVTGYFYTMLAGVFTFIPDEIWANFLAFMVTFIIASIILSLIFLIPRRILEAAWPKGFISSILGGIFSIMGFSISLVLFAILINTYPIFDWLTQLLISSQILNWLLHTFDFIQFMLPEVFRNSITAIMAIPV
jgi:uncharacterized membrane protein required for colicin V production